MGHEFIKNVKKDNEINTTKRKNNVNIKSNNAGSLYREIKLYLYLMSKLCIPMKSCTFLSFYCKYVKKIKPLFSTG